MGLEILKYSSLFESLTRFIYYLLGRRGPPPKSELELLPLLPEELVVEILSCLPVKSLMRFKSVSKSWKSLMSDSQLVKLHLHRSFCRMNADFSHVRFVTECDIHNSGSSSYVSPRSMTSLLERADTEAESADISGYRLIGVCNGLICLKSTKFRRKYCYHTVYFWNPATRSLSSSPTLRSFGDFGFGYDSSTDTYKVVHVYPEQTALHVYKMGDNCWRTIHLFPAPNWILRLPSYSYSVSNTINWLGEMFSENDTDLIDCCYKIVSFDLGKPKYTQLALPFCYGEEDIDNYFKPILGVLRGCLCISENNKTRNFALWQMKEFGVHQSWTKLFSINGSEKILAWPCFAISVFDNGDALLLSVSRANGVLYTLRDSKLERKKIADEVRFYYAENYIESLVLPKFK
ncbi:F-box/kelch-repeat protein At3g23880-like [Lotus japonicus]|uniref:F-box/kelch-repeat protein At3g23880-like n=1 Tax=Lotus japonicus TaxID=34305 RepID=UPI00258AB1CE|nr:F-box/kelch-repeat protein At3g23880-like [Lotus japonicus]